MRFSRSIAFGALTALASTLIVPAAFTAVGGRFVEQADHRDRVDQLRRAGHRLEHLG